MHIDSIAGDENCLFRTLSNAVTRSQTQHDILRLYATSYMAKPEVAAKLQSLFAGGDRKAESHTQHVLAMQQAGQWGTEQKIAATAYLLNCLIVCFATYFNQQFCLQHFAPHFIDSRNCTWACQHNTIYVINSSGTHYVSAVVKIAEQAAEE